MTGLGFNAADLILASDGDVLVIPVSLIRALGLSAAAFLRQAAYLSAIVQKTGGWFFLEQEGPGDPSGKTVFERLGSFQAALGLGPRAQVGIRQQLIALNLLQEKRSGMVHGKLQYRVDSQRYLAFLADCGRLSLCLDGQPAHSDCAAAAEQLLNPKGAGCTGGTKPDDVYEVDYEVDSLSKQQHTPMACGSAGAAAFVEEPKRRHPRRTKHGIECWYPSEDDPANAIEALFSHDEIATAVAAVKSRSNSKGKRTSPVPALVAEELQRAHQIAENEARRVAVEAKRHAETLALPSIEIRRHRIAELQAVFGRKNRYVQETTA